MSDDVVRKIIHIDMDAFYASVEIRDNPQLRGLPVVVGGSPDGRGVVAAASYESRRFGIHSAMPCSRAQRLCPEAVFLRPNFEKYRTVSRQIRGIFHRYTDLVEPLSLDEAYLDVTVNHLHSPSATWVAQDIKGAITRETALTASAGVSTNKFLAKIASEEKKPDGLFVIRPDQVSRFLHGLPLGKVPGIGRVTRQVFADMGIHTCGQLQALSLDELIRRFGKRGAYFHRLARGIDERPVEPHRERKSISIEDTFAEDHDDQAWLLAKLKELASGLEKRARTAGVKGRTVTLKMRLADFRILTRSSTGPETLNDATRILPLVTGLYKDSGVAGRKLRLLGIGLAQLDTPGGKRAAPPRDERQLGLALLEEG
ncbi:MAG: DNA polymerase IV [SAR324 cluster bacterium]|nr:DNA polymerase IV [SAR324 cluster bacterium]